MPHRRSLFATSLLAATLACTAAAQTPKYLDPKLPAAERAHDLVSRMTLEEKAAQLEDWATAIPRLGIPDYQTWNEALHGVARAGYATVFPQAIGMAATWDKDMVHSMGNIVSEEARAKYNQAQREGNHRIFYGLTFWSPNINIFRDPRWGRGQETYGEDPYLTGQLGIAFITGVQGPDPLHPRAIATSKHFAVHSGPEQLRHGFNVNPSDHDLEDTYLPAFRATVTQGHVDSVMCAYNSIDKFAACTNQMLLKEHLRDAWGFKGFVVSDCGAIVDVYQGHKQGPDIEHAAAESLKAGTDLSCSIWTPGFNRLADSVKQGLVTEDLVTQAAERLYTARFMLGLFDPQGSNPGDKIAFSVTAGEVNRKESLKAAEKSIVLLKNDGILPLNKPKKIAVIGPTADQLISILGNYVGTPLNPVTPLEGMAQQFKSTPILYAQGSTLASGVGVPVPRTAFGGTGKLKTEFFATPDWTGRPVATGISSTIQADWENAKPAPEIQTNNYSVRWSGTLAPPAAGHYVFTLEVGDSFPYSPAESYRFILDGKVVMEGSLRAGHDLSQMGNFHSAPGASPTAPPVQTFGTTPTIEVDFSDSKPHEFQLLYSHSADQAGGGVTFKWQAPADALLEEAVAAAKQSDVVVAFVGLSPQLEGEEMPIKIDGFVGGDRTSLDLPAPQQKLIEAVAATGKPLIVVLQSGSAVALNWANQHANAILEAWYPGVEGGNAIARTIAGLNNPGGRLPVTFYNGLNDLPDFTDYGMKGRTYRYFTGKPLWGFGYGLSYTKFTYSPVKLSAETLKAGEPLSATVTVTNSGPVAGDEVVEAYLKSPAAGAPIHSLAGFERITLQPGISRTVTLKIDPRSISTVDEQGNRSIQPGKYTISVGSTQPQETQSKSEAAFTITGSAPLPK
ncbi:glycoside hydrolase family 3 C-terminal domain-containing protein [Terracidiphilus gabretensis]|uniref:glycoside hydrolase family 3 C-terminal domain-containing protein n=1 Tax=Terracidiphilus gabretensis TaxID=1577687 RepID=UPI00071BE4F0|nr:glycoside hydrolase family 3 C-terminal domain-containing protein [Terracidiphilus gabretensis]